jgi:hypothetical protein
MTQVLLILAGFGSVMICLNLRHLRSISFKSLEFFNYFLTNLLPGNIYFCTLF